jgi:hypothetical protein
VRVSLQDRDTGRYLQGNGTMAAAIAYRNADVTPPNGTSTTWTLPRDHLADSRQLALHSHRFDTMGQQAPERGHRELRGVPERRSPHVERDAGAAAERRHLHGRKIVVTGRAEDAPDANASIASVQVAVVNSAGQYMSSTGAFTSTTASFRNAFLNSPGSAASNYSYTTPVIPSGTYTVIVQPVDVRGQIGVARTSTGITVGQPSNNAPVASFTYSCAQNVCTFDGRGSTDENPSSLTYAWNFGTQGAATDPCRRKRSPPRAPSGDPDGHGRVEGHQHVGSAERDDRRAVGQQRPGPDLRPELPGSHMRGEQPGHGRPQHRRCHHVLMELG